MSRCDNLLGHHLSHAAASGGFSDPRLRRRADYGCGGASLARTVTLQSMLEDSQWAIELDHFTPSPYLCALCSIDAVRNPQAAEVVASILLEEMLHMMLLGHTC
jgi:hypothetical protein